MHADNMITVYRACGQLEAQIVKGRLDVEEIPSILKYESLGTVYGLTVDGLGQVEVQVPAMYADMAGKILAESTEHSQE